MKSMKKENCESSMYINTTEKIILRYKV